MKTLNVALIFLFALLLLDCKKEKDPDEKAYQTDNPRLSVMDLLVDSIFSDYASKPKTSGFSVAIIDGDQTYKYNYGETELGNQFLPNDSTFYEIGSITKTFAAMAVVYWLNQQGIDINTPVSGYLPSNLAPHLSLNETPVTFRHILNHSSGLPRIPDDLSDPADPYGGYDSAKVYSYVLNHSLLRTPGTLPVSEQEAFNYYSNLAYSLAGLILERQQQKSLQSILEASVLSHCGMQKTFLGPLEDETNRAFPNNPAGNASYWHMTGTAAAGGLKSCLADMIRYARVQLNATGVSAFEEAVLTCQSPTVQINGKDFFGLGWEFFHTSDGKRITVKDGGTGGFTSFIAFDREENRAVVALFNNSSEHSPATPFVNLMEAFFK